ncbi:Endoglucanase-like protein [Hapsidospora chrysogenum ATCC 11550]|uniref:lytic cellulose monooxygenase (C4-dehydrogenating) n=1 Tax=Hapsidospora chrysogenum (strain ATCC 11550 / CBS 779.69 / DSM 880 / IAM 14645 / JCM 23072 / IMI 49137) TaxID=857340 RepID=A0A086SUN0_HAPC1|nr:Endoglucanase-like protein [Hapsidospora chrysogenum ATCC 11550]
MSFATRTLASALAGAATVAAHGFVTNVVINGVSYSGYDVTSFPYQNEPPVVIGWSTTATDTGFVAPDAYSSPDIICHRDGENAQGRAQVAAGDSVFLQWNTWPDSHHGPVIDYLARCGDVGCESVDKTSLEFFKISESGLLDSSGSDFGTPGFYAADELLNNNMGWMVRIPDDLAPGNYVLRHEIIALHSAHEANGAQNYPQCFNLEVTGSGTRQPEGVLGTELYSADDEGIAFNIYGKPESYPIPGPPLVEGGASDAPQATSASQQAGTATQGSGSAPTGPAAPPAPEPTSGPEPTQAPEPTPTSDSGTNNPDDVSTSTSSQQPDLAKPTTPPASGGCKGKKGKRGTRKPKASRRSTRKVFTNEPLRRLA